MAADRSTPFMNPSFTPLFSLQSILYTKNTLFKSSSSSAVTNLHRTAPIHGCRCIPFPSFLSPSATPSRHLQLCLLRFHGIGHLLIRVFTTVSLTFTIFNGISIFINTKMFPMPLCFIKFINIDWFHSQPLHSWSRSCPFRYSETVYSRLVDVS